jgi:hypothetical protein
MALAGLSLAFGHRLHGMSDSFGSWRVLSLA